MDRRSYTRLLSVQAFYLLSFSDDGCSASVLLSSILTLQKNHSNKNKAFSAESSIVNGCTTQICYDEELFTFLIGKFRKEKTVIDSIIAQFINKEWSLKRMDLVLISIIRAAVCELLYLLDIPKNIIIDEYVNLSSLSLKIEETNFINAILSSIAKHLRKDQDSSLNVKEDLLLTTSVL